MEGKGSQDFTKVTSGDLVSIVVLRVFGNCDGRPSESPPSCVKGLSLLLAVQRGLPEVEQFLKG